jgi:hypothetical protein
MASRAPSFPVVLVAIVAAAGVLWWITSRPDPGAVDRVRDEPDAFGSGVPNELSGPVVTLTSSMGDPGGSPSGTVTTGSMWLDADDATMTATSLVDGEPVWTYQRDDESIDGWAASADVAWVLFGDHLLARVDVVAGKVDDSTVFDRLYEEDDAPALTGDGSGGVVLQGPSDAERPVWWVGEDLDPVALNLPKECDTYDDVTSDGERIYLIAVCDGDERRVLAFGTDGSSAWGSDPSTATSIEVDRGQVVVHRPVGSEVVDAGTGEVESVVPAGDEGLSYVTASEGLVAAWESTASNGRPSLAVWSVDERRFVWRLPGMGDRGEVSAPLLSDGQVYFTETTYGDEPRHQLVVVDVASGGATSTDLTAPEAEECEGSASFLPRVRAGIPGAIVVSWQDDDFCADPVLEVYANAS